MLEKTGANGLLCKSMVANLVVTTLHETTQISSYRMKSTTFPTDLYVA